MIFKNDDQAVWVGFENTREIMLFVVAIGSISDLTNEAINDHIRRVAIAVDYDEISLVEEGIDGQSARELADAAINGVVGTK